MPVYMVSKSRPLSHFSKPDVHLCTVRHSTGVFVAHFVRAK